MAPVTQIALLGVVAFSPLVSSFVQPRPAPISARRTAQMKTRRSETKMLAIGPIMESAKWVLAGPALYSLMSVNEYFTHRYYQHAEYNKATFFQGLANVFNLPKKIRGGGHVEHHAGRLLIADIADCRLLLILPIADCDDIRDLR